MFVTHQEAVCLVWAGMIGALAMMAILIGVAVGRKE